MTREDIIRMAREAGIIHPEMVDKTLERFAALVAAAEREACAKVCEALVPFGPELALQKATAEDCAIAIRARGERMTDRELMQQALEALEKIIPDDSGHWPMQDTAITALREQLEGKK